jgi:hypothetical protein
MKQNSSKSKNKPQPNDLVTYEDMSKLYWLMYQRSKVDSLTITQLTDLMSWFKNHILKLEKANEMIVDKYEDKYEEYEKANEDLKKQNTELTLNVEELKERLFGKLTMRLKEFATRPDKKKDN